MILFFTVLKASKQDFVTLSDIQKFANEDNVLRLEGLPWNSKELEIREFFYGKLLSRHFDFLTVVSMKKLLCPNFANLAKFHFLIFYL